MNTVEEEIVITRQDSKRLNSLIETYRQVEDTSFLENEISRAMIVAQRKLPSDVVTMHSVVLFRDEVTLQEREVGLVYPNNADASRGRISILAPLGAALLGLRVGQTFSFKIPGNKTRKIKVLKVSFQPEAYGAYDL